MRIAVLDLYARGKGPPGPSVAEAVMAVQRQLDEHFRPAWGCQATLMLRRAPNLTRGCFAEDLPDVDGILYISPKFKVMKEPALENRRIDGTSAFHFEQHGGIPCGFVFPEIAALAGTSWSVLLSHEILEMVIDPDVNLLVGGVHPPSKKTILLSYEICDPVQSSSYDLSGVEVSNFVLPQYYKILSRRRGAFEPTNYLNVPLPQFDVVSGGCYWYFEPRAAAWRIYPDADYGLWAKARTKLHDVPRTKRRVAKFLDRGGWETLWYGCPAYSTDCTDDGGNG